MIKWPITYTDYNGEEQTDEFYFNLNRAEIVEMNLNANGAYAEYLQRLVERKDGREIAKEFKNLILKSYGEKSADGRRFIKSKELSEAFEQTEAFVELYLQLATDEEAAMKFISGVMPNTEEPKTGAPVPENMRLV